MRIGNFEDFEDALDAAVLAIRPVERIEGNVGTKPRQHLGDVALDVDTGDAETLRLQRIGAGVTGGERHRPLARPALHENGDVLRQDPPLPLICGLRGPLWEGIG